MPQAKQPKIKIVCAHCGSEEVFRDAWAEWDIANQEWVLQNVFDAGYCNNCEGEASLDEEEIEVEDAFQSNT